MLDRIQVIQGDITQVSVDAIVNAANTSLLGGGGVDGAIHRAGGREILEECRKIVDRQGSCRVGRAVITTAGRLPAKWVIHTVGPIWEDGNQEEGKKLYECYQNSLRLAVKHDCISIAFPNISTGVYGFPKPLAAKIAVQAVTDFLSTTDQIEQMIFVCFDAENFELVSEEVAGAR